MLLTTSLIGIAAGALASQVAEPAPGLEAEWLYNGINQPIMIQAASPRSLGPVTLVLMDAAGGPLLEPVPVRPGRIDLVEIMPDLGRLRRAAYLQMMVGEEPVGSALVVQPMLSRLVPQTEEALTPSGVAYTRIVGWRDETQAEAAREEAQTPPETVAEGEASPNTQELLQPWLAEPGATDRLLTGFRIYPERDVMLQTSAGDVHLAMRPDCAPNTAWNFLALAEGGFYRGISFHRIVPLTAAGDPFVIQAGDPAAHGSGGPGYWLPMEPSFLPHDFGVISMARDADPDSAGSQFFICLSREGTGRLDGSYCAFGYAVNGRDTILGIADVELADIASGRPSDPPIIQSAELIPAPPRYPGQGRPDRPVTREEQADQPARPTRVPR